MNMLICCAVMLGMTAPDLTGVWTVEAAEEDGRWRNVDAVCFCNGSSLIVLDRHTLVPCLSKYGLGVVQDPNNKTWVDFRVRVTQFPDPIKPVVVPPFKGLCSVKGEVLVLYYPTDSDSARPLKIPETCEAGHVRIVLKRIGPYPEVALPKNGKNQRKEP